jgi:hypothetical protein
MVNLQPPKTHSLISLQNGSHPTTKLDGFWTIQLELLRWQYIFRLYENMGNIALILPLRWSEWIVDWGIDTR